jgi:PAS domain-containing protein
VTAIAQTAAVPVAPPQRVERTRFCSRCAVTADEPEPQNASYGFDRVCDSCGMGVMLAVATRALPGPGAAFVVVTREGRISAVSEAAEAMVGEEAGVLGMPISTVVSSPDGDEQLVRALARAAGGGREVRPVTVTPAARPGGRNARLSARIASCGPPRAALLVLERAALI